MTYSQLDLESKSSILNLIAACKDGTVPVPTILGGEIVSKFASMHRSNRVARVAPSVGRAHPNASRPCPFSDSTIRLLTCRSSQQWGYMFRGHLKRHSCSDSIGNSASSREALFPFPARPPVRGPRTLHHHGSSCICVLLCLRIATVPAIGWGWYSLLAYMHKERARATDKQTDREEEI